MKTLEVSLGDRSYSIYIGQNVLDDVALFSLYANGSMSVIVTNTTVEPLYANRLENTLKQCGQKVIRIVLPDGESFKDWETLQIIFTELLKAGADRKTTLFALGGGVIGDMTGFAAASYMRGIKFVQIPTTLLSQVDSSVGGKTGINHPLGKNMIGAFYQPIAVMIDLNTLTTLPKNELSAGLAEVAKHGAIADATFLDWIEAHVEKLTQYDLESLEHAVIRSCEIKSAVVAQDEKENGVRAYLNFGHTFGHAIETGMGYGKWLHGEAVGCGMAIAAELSHQLGYLTQAQKSRLVNIIHQLGLPTQAPDWNTALYLSYMSHDKKAQAGKIQYIVLSQMGQAKVMHVADDIVAHTLKLCGAS